jgi:AcrR family transcriptional regulator
LEAQRNVRARNRTVPDDHPRWLELIGVAARLFSERGFRGTSMEDIADSLGVTKASLYYWVSTKEELLNAVLLGSLEGGIREGERIIGLDLPAAERLRLLLETHVIGWTKNRYHYSAFLSEYRWLSAESLAKYRRENQLLEDIFKQVIFEGISRGEFKLPREHVGMLVKMILAMLGSFPRWYKSDGWATPLDISHLMFRQLLVGLRGGLEGVTWPGGESLALDGATGSIDTVTTSVAT